MEATTELWEHCKKFIEDQRIHCSESVYQTDRVIENAYEFIEGICDIVGYYEDEDDDEYEDEDEDEDEDVCDNIEYEEYDNDEA